MKRCLSTLPSLELGAWGRKVSLLDALTPSAIAHEMSAVLLKLATRSSCVMMVRINKSLSQMAFTRRKVKVGRKFERQGSRHMDEEV